MWLGNPDPWLCAAYQSCLAGRLLKGNDATCSEMLGGGGVKVGFPRRGAHLQPHEPVYVLGGRQIAVVGESCRMAQGQGGVVELLYISWINKHQELQ